MGQTAGLLHLKTFGGLSIASNGVPVSGAAQQRKTLALLALLAAAGKSGLGRDKLVAYLWPDADAEHARGLLKQACYALRRDLHQPDLLLGTTQLSLNPVIIVSDVQAFEDALERRADAAAAELYAGPFLDGFYLSDAAEFERWVEAARRRLRDRATAALERLAAAAPRPGLARWPGSVAASRSPWSWQACSLVGGFSSVLRSALIPRRPPERRRGSWCSRLRIWAPPGRNISRTG